MLRRLQDALFARPKPPPTEPPAADYAAERETRRVGQLSAEDRAWADASQQRNRNTEADRAARS
jgi:hypothetical protein